MGWYGDEALCPNCKSENAVCVFRNSNLESYYLVCPDCGLHLYAENRLWVVTNSYIDNSIIGKNNENMALLALENIVDLKKNDDIIPKGTVL